MFRAILLLCLTMPTVILAVVTPCSPGYGNGPNGCQPCQPGTFQPAANLEACLQCPEPYATPRIGATQCDYCWANNTVPNKPQTRCIALNSAEAIVNALEGTYENLLYSGNQKNDWHYVQITAKPNSEDELTWSNRAGVQWTLKLKESSGGYERGSFIVEADSPYHASGHTSGVINWSEPGDFDIGNYVLGVTGPWKELYTRV